MGTLADKLNKVLQTKNAIKQALINKGQTVTDKFSTYPSLIDNLTDDRDATATASDIANGKTAYARGSKVTGNYIAPPFEYKGTITAKKVFALAIPFLVMRINSNNWGEDEFVVCYSVYCCLFKKGQASKWVQFDTSAEPVSGARLSDGSWALFDATGNARLLSSDGETITGLPQIRTDGYRFHYADSLGMYIFGAYTNMFFDVSTLTAGSFQNIIGTAVFACGVIGDKVWASQSGNKLYLGETPSTVSLIGTTPFPVYWTSRPVIGGILDGKRMVGSYQNTSGGTSSAGAIGYISQDGSVVQIGTTSNAEQVHTCVQVNDNTFVYASLGTSRQWCSVVFSSETTATIKFFNSPFASPLRWATYLPEKKKAMLQVNNRKDIYYMTCDPDGNVTLTVAEETVPQYRAMEDVAIPLSQATMYL